MRGIGFRRLVGLLIFLSWTAAAEAQQTPAPAGPMASRWSAEGMAIEVAPLRTDGATAFFLNRGFPLDRAADLVRRGCVFRSSVDHSTAPKGGPAAAFDLGQWRLRVDGRWRPYPVKDRWLREFEAAGLPEAARIAFRWATFPTTQTFQPGDQNWGMHLFGLPPGTVFDLAIVWRRGGERREIVFRDLKCAEKEPENDRN